MARIERLARARDRKSTSAASQEATFAITWPFAGFTQSKVAPEIAGTYLPSMNACVRGEKVFASARQSMGFGSRDTEYSYSVGGLEALMISQRSRPRLRKRWGMALAK